MFIPPPEFYGSATGWERDFPTSTHAFDGPRACTTLLCKMSAKILYFSEFLEKKKSNMKRRNFHRTLRQ